MENFFTTLKKLMEMRCNGIGKGQFTKYTADLNKNHK